MEASLPDIEYIIRGFDATNAQAIVEVPDLDATMAIDLPVGANGELPTAAELNTYIKGFIPVFEIERRQKIKQGLVGGEDIAALVQPRPEPEPVPPTLLEYAATKRWETETGGITVGGISIHTDDRSKLMMTGARLRAENNPDVTEQWNAADGEVYTLTSVQIIALADAVAAHVSACFALFASTRADILSETITEYAQIDTAFDGLSTEY